MRLSANSFPYSKRARSILESHARTSITFFPLCVNKKWIFGCANAAHVTCLMIWFISVVSVLRNFKRAGTLWNKLLIEMCVPGEHPLSSTERKTPPSTFIFVPCIASAVLGKQFKI